MSDDEKVRAGVSESQMRSTFIHLVFGDDPARYERFCAAISEGVPPDVAAVVRGSAVTGFRRNTDIPFDADGPHTSDIDLTLVGATAVTWFAPDGFYIADLHSKPLSDKEPEIAPGLVPLREKLSAMVGRPVNIQATRNWIMFVREYLMGQPYLKLFGKLEPA